MSVDQTPVRVFLLNTQSTLCLQASRRMALLVNCCVVFLRVAAAFPRLINHLSLRFSALTSVCWLLLTKVLGFCKIALSLSPSSLLCSNSSPSSPWVLKWSSCWMIPSQKYNHLHGLLPAQNHLLDPPTWVPSAPILQTQNNSSSIDHENCGNWTVNRSCSLLELNTIWGQVSSSWALGV